MESKNVYQVKINRNTFDVVSANTAFYAFVGERLYSSFDRLLVSVDSKLLTKYIQEEKDVIFSLVAENGEEKKCLASFSASDEVLVDVRMLLLDGIREWSEQVREQVGKKNDILSLYGDYCFEYNVDRDQIRIYAPNQIEQNICDSSFAEFEQVIAKKITDKNEKELRNLISALKTGVERFVVNIEGNLFDIKDTTYTLVKGVCHFRDGKYLYAAGYIHFWNERSVKNAESSRALERDYLTGVLTKAEITNLVVNTVDVKKTFNVTLGIIDIDYFKKVNDVYGHMKGDEVLKKVASIIQNEVREDGLVGRFGGDEFLVLFYNAYDMENMRERLRSIKNSVASSFVKTDTGEDISITLSIGCAAYPKDADNYEDLFALADFALYRAKEKGRNRYIIYDKEKHGTLEELKSKKIAVNTINSRGNMSPAELICAMQDKVYTGEEYPLDKLLDDVALNMNIQRVVVYAGHPRKLVGMAGANRLLPEVVEETRDYLDSPALTKLYDTTGILVINKTKRFETSSPTLYEQLKKQEILSLVQVRFQDKNGVDAVLSLEYVKNSLTWNRSYFLYYRLLARLLSEYRFDL